MNQMQLGLPTRESAAKKLIEKGASKFAKDNIESAEIILRNEDQFGGSEAALVRWAKLTLQRLNGGAA